MSGIMSKKHTEIKTPPEKHEAMEWNFEFTLRKIFKGEKGIMDMNAVMKNMTTAMIDFSVDESMIFDLFWILSVDQHKA